MISVKPYAGRMRPANRQLDNPVLNAQIGTYFNSIFRPKTI